MVELQLHRNDYQVRHARRILQERATRPNWDLTPTTTRLVEILESSATPPVRLRALWALQVISRLDAGRLLRLLDDDSAHLRAWAVRLLCERETPEAKALAKLADRARHDSSPVVRLELASGLQRLPLERRWGIAEGLISHAADAADANLPLMDWYGIEPLVPADPARALGLALKCEVPLVRQFIARRVVDDALAKGERGDLAPLVAAMAKADAQVARDLLAGAREGIRGRKSLTMPDGWPAVYAKFSKSNDAAIRAHAVVLALVFGDPQALADLRRVALDPAGGASERVAALEALIDKRVPGLAPTLFDQLADKATRRAALRGLAAYPHADTPRHILAVYAELTSEEKADAIGTLASRKDFALALLDAVEKKRVPRRDISAYAARQMFALADATVTERLRAVWGEVRETAAARQKQLARFKAQISPTALKSADPRNGRLVFSKTCQQCHKLYGQGGTIGPDLTGSNRSDLDYLLANIIDPSAEVARDFRMSVVRTKDERVMTGIITERTAGAAHDSDRQGEGDPRPGRRGEREGFAALDHAGGSARFADPRAGPGLDVIPDEQGPGAAPGRTEEVTRSGGFVAQNQ